MDHETFRRRGTFSKGFFRNGDFDFDVRIALGHANSGAADVGEVLAALDAVGEKDHAAWYAAWNDLGTQVAARGDAEHAAGNDVSAAWAALRAATYLGIAVNAAAALPGDDAVLETFRRHRAAWDAFVDRTAYPVQRVEIPYEGSTLPGYVFRPDASGARRPTFVMNNGSDGAISSMWAFGAHGALLRGYNVLMFDGPGQQSQLFEHGVPFRPDWEAVITPVVDFLLARSDVDGDRLALYGVSQGGYWVPRALAFEHRFAAAIADPGVVDVSTSWTDHLPGNLKAMLQKGDKEHFDRDMAMGMKFSHELARTWNFRARPYQQDGYYDTLAQVARYTVADVANQITTPLLITSPEGEQFWPGQSERLAALTPGVSTLVPFTAAEGADLHCQPLARSLTDERMFDWLAARLG
jgi:hypothetical protein